GPVCPDEALLEQEGAYTTALGWTNHYRLTEGTLELSTSRGETLAFERVPSEAEPALEGPTWMLLAFVEPNPYDESPNRSPMPSDVLSRTEITAILEGSRAQGSTGCNSYGASYTRDGSALRFEGITFTEMACLDPEGVMLQEGRFLEYMATVATFRIYGDQLWLETSDGRALVFTR
ncbi:MAG TPA: META domain-containing protein, partial [Anaerolineae bacterium]|nr:META domain-containing protein [Anaerolineae bacterium]